MMHKILLISLLAVLVVSGCTQSSTDTVVLSDENPDTEIQEVSIEVIQGDFSPNRITVKKGVPVQFSITSTGIAEGFEEHGLSIKELGIDVVVPLNETKVIEFTPDTSGSFVFFCSVFCGQGHIGQAGILEVIE
jgi:cytochrome c oxidase subunit II